MCEYIYIIMNLSKIIIKSMELVEKYIYDSGFKKKESVLNLIKQEIGDKKYDELKQIISDTIEVLIDLSKRRIKLELNKRKWTCIS